MNQTGSFTCLDDWLPWLETLSPREIDLGLDRVVTVLGVLELPQAERVINVAGTNGKGSSVAMLEALFASAGHKTACFTSPHVLRYNERIRIDGVAASDEQIIAAFERVQSARLDVPLTYFEFGTLAALVVFAESAADTLILEVGMGGRLDAVNAVEPDACLITNIALDHTAWLGDDTESIAAEKAGIMRAAKPVVFGAANCSDTITQHAASIGADLRLAGRDFAFDTDKDAAGSWSWRGRQHQLADLRPPSLAGSVQIQNAAAVLALLEAMGHEHILTTAQVNDALGSLELPGRFQVIKSGRTWVLDVAHNPAAAAVLAESLRSLSHEGRITAIVGMLADKDVKGIVEPLSELVESWIAVPVTGSRAEPAAVLAQNIANCCNKPCRIAATIPEALETADRQAAADGLILVTGSFYTVGPALEWLQDNDRLPISYTQRR
jgi:dihydrofolate synthase/folylpolyglutamate synthase